MNRGLLLVVSGPSGAGKDDIVEALVKKDNNLVVSVSDTTRPIKEDDIEGKEYNFITNKEFFKKVDQGLYLEWAEVYGNYYGTLKHKIKRLLDSGKDVIVKVDIKGALNIKEKIDDAVLIFILPKSMEELRQSMLEKKSDKDSPDSLLRRFNSAYAEISSISKYNYAIVNDNNIEDSINKIENIIKAEKIRVDRIKDELEYLK